MTRRWPWASGAVLGACCTLWCWRLGSAASADYDEGVYLVSARLLLHGHRAFAEVFSSQPPLFLDLLHAVFRAFGDTVLAGRGLVVAAAVIACALTGRLAWTLIAPRAAPWAMALCGASTLFLYGARTVQAELPALALALGGLALVAGRPPGHARRAAAGALLGLALATKLLVAPLALPLLAAAVPWRGRPAEAVRAALVTGAALLLAFALALAPHGLGLVLQQCFSFHLDGGARALDLGSPWPSLRSEAPLVLAGAGGLVALARRRPGVAAWLALWLAAAAALLLVHQPVFRHHLVLLIPPLALAASGLVAAPWPAAATACVLGLAGLLRLEGGLRPAVGPRELAQVVLAAPPPEEVAAVAALRAFTAPGEPVATDAQWLAFLAGRDVPPPLCDTSFKRIAAGSLTAERVRAEVAGVRAVLPWSGRLAQLPGVMEEIRRGRTLVAGFPLPGQAERGLYLPPGAGRSPTGTPPP